jgi:hypothetical protein
MSWGRSGWLVWLVQRSKAILKTAIPASSTLTRELLGWHPTHPGLIDDLDKGHYFHNPSA